jgi:hypothetical protein
VFHMNVVKVDHDVACTASVLSISDTCCKRLFKVFHLFQTHVASVLIWMLHMFPHICCNNMLQMFQLFHSCVSIFMLQVFYLDVPYISQICCKCIFQMFHLFQIYVAFKCFMLQMFRVSEVCSESHGGTARTLGEGARRARGSHGS